MLSDINLSMAQKRLGIAGVGCIVDGMGGGSVLMALVTSAKAQLSVKETGFKASHRQGCHQLGG